MNRICAVSLSLLRSSPLLSLSLSIRSIQAGHTGEDNLVTIVERDVTIGNALADLGHVVLGVQKLQQVDEEVEVGQNIHERPALAAALAQLALHFVLGGDAIVHVAVGLGKVADEHLGSVLLDGHHGQEEVVLDRLAFLALLDGREGFVDVAESGIGPHLQSTFGGHLHALTADLEGLEGDVAIVPDGNLDGNERRGFDPTGGLELEFGRHDDLGGGHLEALLARRMAEYPTHAPEAELRRQRVDLVLVGIVQDDESLGRVRIGLLGWFVDGLDDNVLGLVGWGGAIVGIRRDVHLLFVLGIVLHGIFVVLVFLESTIEQPKALTLEVEPTEIRLEIVGRRSVEAASTFADPGLLLAFDLVISDGMGTKVGKRYEGLALDIYNMRGTGTYAKYSKCRRGFYTGILHRPAQSKYPAITHLEDVLVVHGGKFRQGPLHLHVPQSHLSLAEPPPVVPTGAVGLLGGDQLDAPVLADDALHGAAAAAAGTGGGAGRGIVTSRARASSGGGRLGLGAGFGNDAAVNHGSVLQSQFSQGLVLVPIGHQGGFAGGIAAQRRGVLDRGTDEGDGVEKIGDGRGGREVGDAPQSRVGSDSDEHGFWRVVLKR